MINATITRVSILGLLLFQVAISVSAQGVFSVDIGDSQLSIVRLNDPGVVAAAEVEFFPETDRIKNLQEVDQTESIEVFFERPVLSLNLSLVQMDSPSSRYNSIQDIASRLGFSLSPAEESAIQSSPIYSTIRISNNDLTIYLLKTDQSTYRVFVIELNGGRNSYDSSIPLEATMLEIVNKVGRPNFLADGGQVFMYRAFSSLRQLNIYWNGDSISMIQYVAWFGK